MNKQKLQSVSGLDNKKPRHRSPNYPSIGLRKAIERARALYDNARSHKVSLTVAANLWGYAKPNANMYQEIAALKAFGLIDTIGEGAQRQINVTEAARRIILDSPEGKEFLKQAALKPQIHAELWTRFGEGGLPSDEILRDWLLFDKKFNEMFVNNFIAQFRDTLAFAKITEADKIEVVAQEDYIPKDEVKQMLQPEIQNPQKPLIQDIPPSPVQVYSDFPLYLSNNRKGVLRLPTVDNRKDYALLDAQIKNALAVLKAIAGITDDPENEKSE